MTLDELRDAPPAELRDAATLTRDKLRADINVMEALDSVLGAIDEVSGVELEPGDRPEMTIEFSDDSRRRIASASAIPNAVALAGLRAMQGMLEKMLLKETA